ncbi:ClpP/crotonase-like domain-containing protein [Cladochytrium replicatum]|nr:ClpP/crotonase-like domain-containing protein [Cladochytrium replicatum]
MTIIKETAKNIAKTIGKIAGEDKLASELTLGYEAFEGFALAELLTEHLRTVSRNPDYKVEYDPQNPAKMVREDGIVVEGVSTSYSKSGIENLEILSGDVGYINISHFGPKNQSASTFKAAMSVLQYTSALIIDLRKTLHVTGSGDSANELLSYFTSKNIQYKYVKWANKRPKRERSLKKVPGLRYNGDGLRRRAVYVLTSVETISTAEAFSHFMKMLGLAKVVGEATLGSCQSAVRIQRCGHNDFKVSYLT